MAPKCTEQLPTFRVNMHSPATAWHPHQDNIFTMKKPTDWEAWAHTMREILVQLTAGNGRLMVGYWLDAMNILPPNVRAALLAGIAQGLGLEIKSVEGETDTIEVNLVPRYPPLVGEKKTPGGLVVPQSDTAGLAVPGQPGFNAKG